MIRPEDRGVVIAVAVQIFCARIQSYESKRVTGETKHGYSPDLELCVGEAAALVNRVDSHLPPQHRPEAMTDRRKNHHRTSAVEISFRGIREDA